MNSPPPHESTQRVSLPVHAQLAIDVVQVPVDRAVVDAELLGGLLGTRPLKQEQHDLAFAPTEAAGSARGAHAAGEINQGILGLAAEVCPPLGRLADGVHQIPRCWWLD